MTSPIRTPRTDAEERWFQWNGDECKGVHVEFARQLERELSQSRDDALEEAARVCDEIANSEPHSPGYQLAAAKCRQAIRSLKAKPAPIASGDAVDAERYRWLREQSHPWGKIWYSLHVLDQHIDAAIRKGAE